MTWKPNTTVAAIVEQHGKFLLVEEHTDDGLRLNQPAGHLEQGETLLQAVIRETQEETAYLFQPQALLGVYQWTHPSKEITYMRFAFIGTAGHHNPAQPLDEGIVRSVWLSHAELLSRRHQLRSPQVLTCVEHYLAGQSFPLSVLTHVPPNQS